MRVSILSQVTKTIKKMNIIIIQLWKKTVNNIINLQTHNEIWKWYLKKKKVFQGCHWALELKGEMQQVGRGIKQLEFSFGSIYILFSL